jgi:hypothetical protein
MSLFGIMLIGAGVGLVGMGFISWLIIHSEFED